MLKQRSTPEGAKVKQVQHDKMMEGEKNKSVKSVPNELENSRCNVQDSKEGVGFCHPELVSGSEESNSQMLNQVQHDK